MDPIENIAPWEEPEADDQTADPELMVDSKPEDDAGDDPAPEGEDKPEEPEEKPEEPKAEEKPRKRGPPGHIPYDRFKEVNDKMRAYEAQLAEYQAKDQKAMLDNLPDPDSIDPRAYKSKDEYVKAVKDAISARERVLVKIELEQAEVKKTQKNYEKSLVDNFTRSVDIAVAINPEIEKSVTWIGSIAASINPAIREALMSEEHAAELCHDLANDDEFAEKVLNAKNPIIAIRELSRRGLQHEKEAAKGAETQTPKPVEKPKPEAPRVPRATPGGNAEIYKTKTAKELVRLHNLGRIKAPWE